LDKWTVVAPRLDSLGSTAAMQLGRVPFSLMIDLWTALDRIIASAPDANALRTHCLGLEVDACYPEHTRRYIGNLDTLVADRPPMGDR
jgi:hypothetical protein